MKVIDYNTLKEKIDNKYETTVNVEFYPEQKKQILSKLFKHEEISTEIDWFKIIPINDIIILEYKDLDKNEINTVIVKDNKPVFRIKHYDNGACVYHLDTYLIYDEDGYLENRICVEGIFKEASYITNIKILEKETDDRVYNKREYTFYKNLKEIIAFKSDDKMKIEDEIDFSDKLKTAISHVEDISVKINNKLDDLLGYDCVKEYIILRKSHIGLEEQE